MRYNKKGKHCANIRWCDKGKSTHRAPNTKQLGENQRTLSLRHLPRPYRYLEYACAPFLHQAQTINATGIAHNSESKLVRTSVRHLAYVRIDFSDILRAVVLFSMLQLSPVAASDIARTRAPHRRPGEEFVLSIATLRRP